MEPTSDSVKQFLKKAKQVNPINTGWVVHSLAVGDAAASIAQELHARNYKIDPEQVRLMGYVHDIGKLDGNFNFLGHLLGGYAHLKRLEFPDELCTAPLTHSFIKNDPHFTLSGSIFEPQFLPTTEYLMSLSDVITEPDKEQFLIDFIIHHEFSLTEKVVSLCDLMCYTEVMTLDQRIVNIISRHGTWENTQSFINEITAIKSEIDTMLGHNIYDLFPEIKEHL